MRCIGHVINLSLQAFLLASSKEALSAALESSSSVPGSDMIAESSTTLDTLWASIKASCKGKDGETQSNVVYKGGLAH